MKIVFAGTPEFAVPSLYAVCEAGFSPLAVLTQPDKPQGRKGVLTPSPVKRAAQELNLPVLQPIKLREDFAALKALGADLMVTCAYGQILSQEVLDLFPLGVWNIHASLLPAYRGAAPIARAIIAGERVTGITIMKTDVGIDTGDVFLSEKTEILPSDTCGSLTGKLALLGAKIIKESLSKIACGKVELKKQGEGFVCKKVARTQVDFSRPAWEVSALIRGLSPAPAAYSTVNGLVINFYSCEAIEDGSSEPFGTVLTEKPKQGLVIKCDEGAVRISLLQPAGGKCMAASDFLNGGKLKKGMRFDQPVL